MRWCERGKFLRPTILTHALLRSPRSLTTEVRLTIAYGLMRCKENRRKLFAPSRLHLMAPVLWRGALVMQENASFVGAGCDLSGRGISRTDYCVAARPVLALGRSFAYIESSFVSPRLLHRGNVDRLGGLCAHS